MSEEVITNPIDQTHKYEKTSQKYNFISSNALVEQFEMLGWIKKATFVRSCRGDRKGYQLHTMYFSKADLDNELYSVEATVWNAHDGNNALRFSLSIFDKKTKKRYDTGNVFIRRRIVPARIPHTRLQEDWD